MKERLEEYFGCEVRIREDSGKLQLPIFMTMRHIRLVEIAGVEFALVNIEEEAELSVAAMRKQQSKYEEALQCPTAYEMTVSSLAMRNALVKNGISFIDIPGNVFLPFLGIVLLDGYRKQHIRTEKMMPATQMVFLKLMYMEDDESALKGKIASELGLTKTSVTRATAQLEEMGLIMQRRSGTEISIKRNLPRKEYYDKAKQYLINPVQRIITTTKNTIIPNRRYAGETALSLMSELNPPRIEELALYKADKIVEHIETVDERLNDPAELVRIQLWKYDPLCFADRESVDRVSLACSFMGNEDERIEMSIEKLLEEL